MIKTLAYISKLNKNKIEMNDISKTLMKNLKLVLMDYQYLKIYKLVILNIIVVMLHGK